MIAMSTRLLFFFLDIEMGVPTGTTHQNPTGLGDVNYAQHDAS